MQTLWTCLSNSINRNKKGSPKGCLDVIGRSVSGPRSGVPGRCLVMSCHSYMVMTSSSFGGMFLVMALAWDAHPTPPAKTVFLKLG